LVQSVCLFVCLSVGLLANLWTDFDEIFWRGRAWLKDRVIQFCWRSGSCFGFGSPKSKIRILWIGGGLCCLSISSFNIFTWNQYFCVLPTSVCVVLDNWLLNENTTTATATATTTTTTFIGIGWLIKVLCHTWHKTLAEMFFPANLLTTTTILQSAGTVSGTTWVSWYQIGKMRKVKPVWIYCSKG